MRTLSFTPLPAPNPPLIRTMVGVVFTGCVPTATSWRLNSAPRRLCCRRLVRSWRTCVQSWLMPLHEQPVPRKSGGKCQRSVVLCRSFHCTLMHHNDPELRSNHSIRASQAYRGKWILCLSHLTRQPHRGYADSVVSTAECLSCAIDTPVALQDGAVKRESLVREQLAQVQSMLNTARSEASSKEAALREATKRSVVAFVLPRHFLLSVALTHPDPSAAPRNWKRQSVICERMLCSSGSASLCCKPRLVSSSCGSRSTRLTHACCLHYQLEDSGYSSAVQELGVVRRELERATVEKRTLEQTNVTLEEQVMCASSRGCSPRPYSLTLSSSSSSLCCSYKLWRSSWHVPSLVKQ